MTYSPRNPGDFVLSIAAMLVSLCAVAMVASADVVDYEYDAAGRLKSTTQSDGKATTYTLDPAGNRLNVATVQEAVFGTLQFSAATYSVGEAGGSVTITASRINGSSGAVSVSYATSNGTATAGSDYSAASGNLSWANGDTASKTFSVPVLEDALVEGAETVNLTLSSPTGGATLGSPSTAVLTINDNDTAPAGSIRLSAATYSVGEAGPSVTITASRVSGSNGAVSVSYATSNGTATSGSDYTAASGTLNWANGDTADKTFSVTVLEDALVEGAETVNLTLSTPTGGATLGSPSTAVLTINDNDFAPPGTIQFTQSSVTVTENGTSVTLTASRVGGSSGAVGVSYATVNGTATAGSDYNAASGTLSWANGNTANKTFTVTIINGAEYEGSENFSATLSSPTGGASIGSPASVTVTITDSSNAPYFSIADATYNENSGNVTMTVTKGGTTVLTHNVSYAATGGTATSGVDYAALSGMLSFAPAETAKTLTVSLIDDAVVEGNESIIVSLSNPTNGAGLTFPNPATLIIVDNDGATVINIDNQVSSLWELFPPLFGSYSLTAQGDVVLNGVDVGDWLSPKIGMGNYEVMVQSDGNSNLCVFDFPGAYNTWLSLGTSRTWFPGVQSTDTNAQCWLQVSIRAVANPPLVLDTATIFFYLNTGT